MSSLATLEKPQPDITRDFLTITIANHMFGIPVLQVQDVLGTPHITNVPLAPPAIAGVLNLRGRIVTAIDVRACLGLAPSSQKMSQAMGVVTEDRGELYSLMVDTAGDVLSLAQNDYEKNPPTLDPQWQKLCQGRYRLKDSLLLVLDIPRLLAGLEKPLKAASF